MLWPDVGLTKRDLYDYFGEVAPVMLPHVRDRPVSLERFRGAVGDGGFFQKEIPKGAPSWVQTAEVPKRGGVVRHVLAQDRETLQWLAQQGCVTPHVFTSRADRLDRPDRLVIDLDPSTDDFGAVRAAALLCGDALRARGLEPFAMVTGSRGIHVVVPLKRTRDVGDVQAWARGFAAELAAAAPRRADDRVPQDQAGRPALLGRCPQRPGPDRRPALRPAPASGRARSRRRCAGRSSRTRVSAPTAGRLRTVLDRLSDLGGDPWAEITKAARALPRS